MRMARNPTHTPAAWPTSVFQSLAPGSLGVTVCRKIVGPRLGNSQGCLAQIPRPPIAAITMHETSTAYARSLRNRPDKTNPSQFQSRPTGGTIRIDLCSLPATGSQSRSYRKHSFLVALVETWDGAKSADDASGARAGKRRTPLARPKGRRQKSAIRLLAIGARGPGAGRLIA